VGKALFLDRDGVVNRDFGYVYEIEKFEFIQGVFEACKKARALGYKIIIITNQSGIGRGYYTEADFQHLTKWMLKRFLEEGIDIAGVYYCPDTPDKKESKCRKPAPGMILDAAKAHGVDMAQSWLIGDKESDIKAAINAGLNQHVLVRSGHPIDAAKSEACYIEEDLYSAIRHLV